jgi:hypothetical protein
MFWSKMVLAADEQRDVDRGRAGLHARRVIAEIASVRLDQRLVPVERRMQVGEILRVVGRRKPPRGYALDQLALRHVSFPWLA